MHEAEHKPVIAARKGAATAGQVAEGLQEERQGVSGDVGDSRNRYIEAMGADPYEEANRAQGFLGQAAQGFAAELMPNLMEGLGAARSRFSGSGGGIRSGGAQQMEERAFTNLFANPMQNKIAQLATHSLGFGQSEAQRGVANAGGLMSSDIGREQSYLGASGAAENRYLNSLQSNAALKHDKAQRNKDRRMKAWEGVGNFVSQFVPKPGGGGA